MGWVWVKGFLTCLYMTRIQTRPNLICLTDLRGITHLTSPPHTLEHNGYVEHRHRHIVETGLSLFSHAKLPLKFWPLAFSTAIYLINILPTLTLQNKCPFYSLFQIHPNYYKLLLFWLFILSMTSSL